MTLKEIIDRCSMSSVQEVRHITEEYGEIVLYKDRMDEWDRVLVDLLGPPKKPMGVKPSQEDLELTKEYGGIWTNQTLFKREFAESILIAMYWPWQDGVRTTLKLVQTSR